MLDCSIVEKLRPKPIWKKCLAQFAFPYCEGSEHVIIKINSSLFKLFLFYSNSLKWHFFREFPWSRILGDRTQAWKEKQIFLVSCLRPSNNVA